MSDPLPDRGRRWIPWGFLGMLALIMIAEHTLELNHLHFTRFYIHDWRVNGGAAREQARGCRTLCFGDSLVKFGVVPRVLEDRLGGLAYNLAVCDGQAASSYFLFRRVLETGARPEAVVVDFAPHLLSPDPRHNLRQWPEFVDVREAIDLGLTTQHAGFFAALTLGFVFPSIKDRHEIRASIHALVRGRPYSRHDEMTRCVERWRLDRGVLLCGERPEYDGAIEASNRGYFPSRWRCHRTNEDYLNRFLALARDRGVRVFWLLPPTVPRFQARRDELGLEAGYDRLLSRMTRKYLNVYVLDARRAGFDRSLFIDPLHLNRRGAFLLSDQVAVSISRFRSAAPGDSRWARLILDGSLREDTPARSRCEPSLVYEDSTGGRRP